MTITIISGAMPGVEQGAIEAAVNLALHWQGWASANRIGNLPAIYQAGLVATSSTDPGMVRRINCQEADGVLVFSTSMALTGIAAFVDRVTEQMGRAFMHVTLNPAAFGGGIWTAVDGSKVDRRVISNAVIEQVRDWIRRWDLSRVYVTGPSADDVPGIQGAVRDALIAILEPFAVEEVRQTTRAIDLIGRELEQTYSILPTGTPIPDPDAVPDPVDSAAPLHVHQTPPEPLVNLVISNATDPGLMARTIARCQRDGAHLVLGDGQRCHFCCRDLDDLNTRRIPCIITTPPEGLDEVQRAQLDASIREAERDVRDEPLTPGDR